MGWFTKSKTAETARDIVAALLSDAQGADVEAGLRRAYKSLEAYRAALERKEQEELSEYAAHRGEEDPMAELPF